MYVKSLHGKVMSLFKHVISSFTEYVPYQEQMLKELQSEINAGGLDDISNFEIPAVCSINEIPPLIKAIGIELKELFPVEIGQKSAQDVFAEVVRINIDISAIDPGLCQSKITLKDNASEV